MSDLKAGNSAEALAQVFAAHAAAKWGASRAEDLQDRLAQTAQTILDLRRQLPDPYTEPGGYPATENTEAAEQQ